MRNNNGTKTTMATLINWIKGSIEKIREWITQQKEELRPSKLIPKLGKHGICFFGTALYALLPGVRGWLGTSLTDAMQGSTFAEKVWYRAGMFFNPPYIRIGMFTLSA